MKTVISYHGVTHASGWETGSPLIRVFKALGHEVIAYGNYHGRLF